jgi:hypothetical protein
MDENYLPKDLPGGLARRREIEDKLRAMESTCDGDAANTANMDLQSELIDELMTIDMGMRPMRRAMAKATEQGLSEKPAEPSSDPLA